MVKNKTAPTEKSPVDFIQSVGHETRVKDGLQLLEMMNRITKMEPRMWGPSIIGYGHYNYKYDSGHSGEAPLIGFSPRKQNLVLYVMNNFEGQQQLLEKLGKHKTGKVCLYINKLADVDATILKQIIKAAFDKEKLKKG